jgi:hypothetical protein
MSYLKYIAITAVTIAAMSLLIHGGAFGKTCQTYEDGSYSCIGDRVLDVSKGSHSKYCKVVTFEGNDKCDKSKAGKGLNTDTFEIKDSKKSQNKNEEIYQYLDGICQDEYHKFCFGESWSSLSEVLLD